MNRELLKLKPKRYLCPYCGGWHDWPNDDYDRKLSFYDSYSCCVTLSCDNSLHDSYKGRYEFFIRDDYFCYSVRSLCNPVKIWLDSKIAIPGITESTERPIVTFEVPLSLDSDMCSCCCEKDICILSGKNNTKVKFGFEFDESDYNRLATSPIQKVKATNKQQIKEDNPMANNLFSLNLEFGINTDENIASTLMGIAVKNGDSWRIYDKAKGEITNLGGIELGNLPLYIVPTTKLTVGDLIKENGEYYYVMEVKKQNIKTMCAKTGEILNIVPVKNILGIDCYSKVVAFVEPADIAGDMDTEKLLMMSAMSGQLSGDGSQANQMSQLAPLMLLSDKLGGDDDITKLILASSMMGGSTQQMNPLLPVLLIKDKFGGKDDMTKLILVSSMMNTGICKKSSDDTYPF